MKVLSHKQIAVSTENKNLFTFFQTDQSSTRPRARQPGNSLSLTTKLKFSNFSWMKSTLDFRNCSTDFFWQKRVQGKPVKDIFTVYINWYEKNLKEFRRRVVIFSALTPNQNCQILTFLPSLNLTGPSIIGIKSHILFNFCWILHVQNLRNQNKVGGGLLLSCEESLRKHSLHSSKRHQLKRRRGGWKAIDMSYNPALCALSLHKNLQSLSSLKSFYFCVSSFTKQIAYFGVILDTIKTVAFLSL